MIDNAEDLDIIMPMYNLLENSQNYSLTSGSLWNYYRHEINHFYDNASDSESFKYKIKIIGKTEARSARLALRPWNPDGSQSPRPAQLPIPPLNTEVTILLKYLSNFLASLDLPLINCKVELDLKWSKNCLLIEEDDHVTSVGFIITSTKLYVPVVTLLISNF